METIRSIAKPKVAVVLRNHRGSIYDNSRIRNKYPEFIDEAIKVYDDEEGIWTTYTVPTPMMDYNLREFAMNYADTLQRVFRNARYFSRFRDIAYTVGYTDFKTIKRHWKLGIR